MVCWRHGTVLSLIRQLRSGIRKLAPFRARAVLAGLAAAAVAAFAVSTALLLIWPSQGMPSRVDAIVMLDGPGERLSTALHLSRAHRSSILLISLGTPYSTPDNACPAKIPGVTIICFNPRPATTQGESEFVGRLARRYHWRSIGLVTMTPQITPARIWLSRCIGPGTTIYAVAAPLPASAWPGALLHEWGAIIRAEVFRTTC